MNTIGKIGIFWIYKHTIMGKAIETPKGQDSNSGLIDSPDNHSDFWENNNSFHPPFPELIGLDYQEIPRGRVIYHKSDDYFVIYLDETLINKQSKHLIRDFFNLQGLRCLWRTDLHYTTQQEAIDLLFDDD